MDPAEHDRDELIRLHRAYLNANAHVDPNLLKGVWSEDPSNLYFNLSGHNYRGLNHWGKLWDYYRPLIEGSRQWRSFDNWVQVVGDVGWITSSRYSPATWHGDEAENPIPQGLWLSRSTEIFRRESAGWRIVHAHFSAGNGEPRPGGV